PTSAPANCLDLWISDAVIGEDGTATVYVSVSNNCGFWAMKYYIVYPKCLSVVSSKDHNVMTEVFANRGDCTPGVQYEEPSEIAKKGFDALGLSMTDIVGDSNYWICAAPIVESVWDDGAVGYGDVFGDGALTSIKFTYIPEENESGATKFPVLLFADPLNRDHGDISDAFRNGVTEYLIRWYDGYVYLSEDEMNSDVCAHAHTREVTVKRPSDGPANRDEGYKYTVCDDCGKTVQHLIWVEGGEPVTVTPGDANGDGRVDMRDVLLMRKHILNIQKVTAANFDNADMDGDGRISMKDVLAVRKKILNIH
ncbi:MAG: dockerin type I repeat-containing protein, partial [Clostridia bacterium]|nr:dockerin type I repeat-containing protein [Clostridia bacterium]